VRGFNEQGTTTTPFQMVVMNQMSRFHLAAEAIRRVPRLTDRAPGLLAECDARIADATAYGREHFEDQPEIRDWLWTD
jgi:xylulose-5-phosphate/fructose-6-phosphate phosphoketolase